MKLKYITNVIAFTMMATLFMGCKKFLDINNNPNAPINENLPISTKFPAAIVNTVNLETGNLNLMGSFWSGYLGTPSEAVGSYNLFKDYNGLVIRQQREGIKFWEESYINLEQYRLIIQQAEKENLLFYTGASKIIQGLIFLRLVDLYNNIPFDDALQGTNKYNPSYEKGSDVYRKAIQLISDGIDHLKTVNGTQNLNDDVLFKGNSKQWIKLGNTLKLRALIMQSETNNNAYIKSEIEKINTSGVGFLSSDESALINPGYLSTSGKLNPFWENYYRNVQNVLTAGYNDLRPTQYYIDQLTADNDPRLNQLFVKVNGNYRGVLFGDKSATEDFKRANTSPFKGPVENNGAPGALLKSFNQPSVLLSDFESLFLQAEAAQRGWLSGNAEQLYNQAITASMKYMGVTEANRQSYLLSNVAKIAAAGNQIEQIISQKWRALYFISGMQSWNDYRRLGFPNIPNSLSAPSADARPLRLMYPESEIGANYTQVQAQGDNGTTTQRIWWDVN